MRAGFVFALAALLSACSGSDEGARPAAGVGRQPVPPLPECPDADYRPCDIAEADCQARMLALAVCLKGSDPVEGLQIDLISKDEYAAILAESYQEDEPEVDHFAQALSGLNLASDGGSREDAIAAQVEFVWGAYFNDEKRIVMIDQGAPQDSVNVDAVLVHELIHALQDADYDLGNWPEPYNASFDGYLTRGAIIEGEARFYQNRVAVPMLGLDIEQVDFEAAIQSELDLTLDEVSEAPWYGNAYGTFAYGIGVMQAYRAWLDDGPAGIDRLFASPPTSTWQIIAPILGNGSTPESIEVLEIAEPAIDGLVPWTNDTLGAWGLKLFMEANRVSRDDSVARALAWRGDKLWVYTDETDLPTYAVWLVELASPADAAGVDAAVRDVFGNVAHGTEGTRVFVSIGEGEGVRVPLPALTDWAQAWLAGD